MLTCACFTSPSALIHDSKVFVFIPKVEIFVLFILINSIFLVPVNFPPLLALPPDPVPSFSRPYPSSPCPSHPNDGPPTPFAHSPSPHSGFPTPCIHHRRIPSITGGPYGNYCCHPRRPFFPLRNLHHSVCPRNLPSHHSSLILASFIYIDHTYKRLVSRQPPKGSKNSEILGRLMRGEFVFKEVTGNIEGLMNGDSENVDVKKGGNRGDKEIQV